MFLNQKYKIPLKKNVVLIEIIFQKNNFFSNRNKDKRMIKKKQHEELTYIYSKKKEETNIKTHKIEIKPIDTKNKKE